MADNMTTELGGQRPEQQLNTQSELDPRSVVTFVYRGENPYMRFLARGLQTRGEAVRVREVSVEDYNAYQDAVDQYSGPKTPEEYQKLSGEQGYDAGLKAFDQFNEYRTPLFRALVGPVNGVIVTDNTLSQDASSFFGRETAVLNGYEALFYAWGERDGSIQEDFVVRRLAPVIEQITIANKKPVLLASRLGDHVPRRSQVSYGQYIERNFHTPVISANKFSASPIEGDIVRESQRTNIVTLLQEVGIDSKEAVLLIDHHLYYLTPEEVQERGLANVEVVRICPCCLGNEWSSGKGSDDKLSSLGFKLFPLQYIEPDTQALDQLIKMVEQKKTEMAKKEGI